METRASTGVPLGSRVARAVRNWLRALHLSPWAPAVLVLGWAAIWGGWAIAHAGWVPAHPASPGALTLSAVSATAFWFSAVLWILALRDLLDFDRRWRSGEYHSSRHLMFHPLWLPPVLLLAGVALGHWVW